MQQSSFCFLNNFKCYDLIRSTFEQIKTAGHIWSRPLWLKVLCLVFFNPGRKCTRQAVLFPLTFFLHVLSWSWIYMICHVLYVFVSSFSVFLIHSLYVLPYGLENLANDCLNRESCIYMLELEKLLTGSVKNCLPGRFQRIAVPNLVAEWVCQPPKGDFSQVPLLGW